MPAETLPMRKIREILRLRFESNLSHEKIARALNVSKGVVNKYLSLCHREGVQWPLPPDIDDAALEAKLFGRPGRPRITTSFVELNFVQIHQDLKKTGVTLQLLWEEYWRDFPGAALRYAAFCRHYRDWAANLKRSMRQVYRAGEKLFVDFAGPTIPVIVAATGEIRRAHLFVAALGASNYTYAEATWTETKADWITAQCRALAFIGGVVELIVPDNPKALIASACRYEPEPNRSYEEFAAHYGTAILPARPRKPRDKAKVENAVLVAERWIIARLRNRQFFSLVELNQAIAALLVDLNNRPFKKLPGCRKSAFEALDRPALKPLPATPFEYAEWISAKVSIDYHVEVGGHYYSVPHALVRKKINVRVTSTTVECWLNGRRVASHLKSDRYGKHSTIPEHMPKAHRAHMEWTPGRLLNWALSIGRATRDVVKWQLESRPHPEQGYRACLGLLRLSKEYSPERLEAACRRALAIGSPRYKSVASILKAKLDTQINSTNASPQMDLIPLHDNIRGPDYYH
jgi:transposase